MSAQPSPLDQMVTSLVPSLSRSLAEQFNVFRVMHHGTHEKQLSNVFAWLLRPDGTHGLASAFQRIFLREVNRHLPDSVHLPVDGYQVVQEVNTSPGVDAAKDIAGIVLNSPAATVVVENYESSDGHGHSYLGYLAHGATGGGRSEVVLLCIRREAHLQIDGWERAVVVTYGELLEALKEHISGDPVWRQAHPKQDFFIVELIQHFTEGPGVVSTEDRIAFIKAMCDTGESARYGYRPQATAAQEFADLLALHAARQFEEGRNTLTDAKRTLRRFADLTLRDQVNRALSEAEEPVTGSRAPFTGQWEWCVTLDRADPHPNVYLEFGPTAVVENGRVAEPVADPDFTRIFVTREASGGAGGIDRIIQTDVGLTDLLTGLLPDDTRLRDAALAILRRP